MKMFDIFKKYILSPSEVLEKAVDGALAADTPAPTIKKKFSKLVNEIGHEAYSVYLEAEEHAGALTLKDYFSKIIRERDSAGDTIKKIAESFYEFDRFFLSLTQSRKPRAGGTFELIIKILFKRLQYPFEEQQVINGKPDFLMPSKAHFDTNPMDCIIFTAKRTLRERWRQIISEGTRGLGFYLATIDSDITEAQLQEMLKNRIYIVTPASTKKEIAHYSNAHNVLSFEEFFYHHLDPAVKRWKENKII